jgi:hypothetical protein
MSTENNFIVVCLSTERIVQVVCAGECQLESFSKLCLSTVIEVEVVCVSTEIKVPVVFMCINWT